MTLTTTEQWEALGNRVKQLRNLTDKSQEKFAKDIQITVSDLKKIEVGTMEDVLSYLTHLDEEYGVNFNWLIAGDGNFFMTHGPKVPIEIYNLVNRAFKADARYRDIGKLLEALTDPVKKMELLNACLE